GLNRHQARETGGSLPGCRPLRGLCGLYYRTPGAHAPGFMLSPAPQAQIGAFKTRAYRSRLCQLTFQTTHQSTSPLGSYGVAQEGLGFGYPGIPFRKLFRGEELLHALAQGVADFFELRNDVGFRYVWVLLTNRIHPLARILQNRFKLRFLRVRQFQFSRESF